ncbi:MAG: cysteine-rich VLP protein [Clostridia bacterium]|nr:cysteine-rich VLP protein [Clostridia bacterium]
MFIRLTPDQFHRCKALIKNQCCNFCDGECLLLDCECPQTITYSLICKWFKNAVLPNNKELYIKLIKPVNTKRCIICGAEYIPKGRNSKYCRNCGKIALNKQKAEYIRKKRYECRKFKP